MKNKLTLMLVAFFTAATSLSALQLSGTAATDASSIGVGSGSFVLVDTGDNGIDFTGDNGVTFTVGGFIGDDYIVAANAVSGGFGVSLPGNALFNIGDGGTANNDSFYILYFDVAAPSGYSTVGGEGFGTLSDASWVLGSNNAAVLNYGGTNPLAQFGAIETTGIVTPVPEPSAFALLAGCFGLGWVMMRRRS